MRDYLRDLVARELGEAEVIRPRLPSLFEPVRIAAGELSGELLPLEEWGPAPNVVSRDDQSNMPRDAQVDAHYRHSSSPMERLRAVDPSAEAGVPGQADASRASSHTSSGQLGFPTVAAPAAPAPALPQRPLQDHRGASSQPNDAGAISPQSTSPLAQRMPPPPDAQAAPQPTREPALPLPAHPLQVPQADAKLQLRTITRSSAVGDKTSRDDASYSEQSRSFPAPIAEERAGSSKPPPINGASNERAARRATASTPVEGQRHSPQDITKQRAGEITGEMIGPVTAPPAAVRPSTQPYMAKPALHTEHLLPTPAGVTVPMPPPTIHVTIGRIEVRATPPLQQGRRDRPVGSDPSRTLSLEEYVKQRARGER
jgi:hypothetical protein